MVVLEQHAPMKMQAMPLADGDAGVAQTIRAMRNLIDQGKKDPVIHELAAQLVRSVRPFDWMGEVRAIGEWVGRNIRFTRDVSGKETLHAARDIARLGIGDCDDFTILICSLLGTVGVKCRIITISNHPDDPQQFSHVYPEALVDTRWIPVDFARRNPSLGRGPEHYFRKRVWNVTSDDFVDVEGLGAAPLIPGGAYRTDIPDARFRRLRSNPILGTGRYGAPALKKYASRRGIGDFEDTASSISDLITAGGQTTANIISAMRASPYNLVPTTAGGQRAGVIPSSQLVPTPIGGISTTTLLLGGLGLLAVVLVARR
jgi:hypothetical protein